MKSYAQSLRRHKLPPVSFFLKRFRYDPATGEIFRRDGGFLPDRKMTLKTDKHGYAVIRFKFAGYRHSVLAHRLGWLLTVGVWPHQIDHINGVPSDNRLSNLRETTSSLNQQNVLRAGGVCEVRRGARKYWRARFRKHDRTRRLFCDAVRLLQDWRGECEVNRRLRAAERP